MTDKKQPEGITLPHLFNPRNYQIDLYAALDNGKNRAFIRWCRRAGKDLACINYMFKKMLEKPGNYYYILPIYAQGRKAIFEGKDGKTGLGYLDHMPKELIKGQINKHEMRFETVNGSLFRIVGGDNYDTSIVGTGISGCVISEYSLQNPDLIDFLRPILRETKGWMIVNGTPRGKNHMYDLEQNAKGSDQWYVSEVQTLWPDLPNYYEVATMEDIDRDRKEGMTEEKIEQEYGVSYVAGQQGAYYADCIVQARKDGRIGSFIHDDFKAVDTFWDLGKNDDTVIWFRQQIGNKLVFIDYYEANGKDLMDYAEILREKGYFYKTHYLPHDGGHDTITGSSKKLLQNCLRSLGLSDDVRIADKPNRKRIAIDLVRSRFSRYCFNEATVSDGLTKLSLYHRKWNDKMKVFLDEPQHDWCSHSADALTTEALTGHINEDDFMSGPKKIITNFNPFED